MVKNLIILPDGTEIFSGNPHGNAIISVAITQTVNDGSELAPGSVCCSEVEAKLFAPGGSLSIGAGTEFTLCKVTDDNVRHTIGLFTMERPTRSGQGTYKFLAYDRVSWLDKDLTQWLSGLTGWPYTVATFAGMVCTQCGLTLSLPDDLPNASYEIRQFSGSGITGRMLMQWIGQITCRFVRATASGAIELAWYTETSETISPSGTYAFFGGSLSYEDYEIAQIQKVQIQVSDDDNGTVYPADLEDDVNTYKITGNYLLTAETGTELVLVAQNIYDQMHGVKYTPCSVSLLANTDINAGDIVTVADKNGKSITVYIMSKVNKGQRDTLECTGSYKRDSSTATNDLSLKALNGKVLNIKKSVDGLRVENADTAGKVASIELNVDGISAQVSAQEGDLESVKENVARIQQTAEDVSIKIQSVIDDGVSKVTTETGYTFGMDGLKIAKAGEEIENRLDHTGMYVTRDGEAILTANKDGVIATDVTVRNYLIIGSHARFEDYSDGTDSERTACFWI